MSFKETVAKVLDKDASLAEKIQTLFREEGIMIASILTAIRIAIRVLVEALLSGGGGTPPPKDEKRPKRMDQKQACLYQTFDDNNFKKKHKILSLRDITYQDYGLRSRPA